MKIYKPQIQVPIDEVGYVVLQACQKLTGDVPAKDFMLMMGTCAMESRFFKRVQDGGGPARGLFQMEPDTAYDMFETYFPRRPDRFWALMELWFDIPRESFLLVDFHPQKEDLASHLVINDLFAAAMARIKYLRDPHPVPETVEDQADYWYRIYQSVHGAGVPDDYMNAWHEVGRDQYMRHATAAGLT